jgi:hypothetical protein
VHKRLADAIDCHEENINTVELQHEWRAGGRDALAVQQMQQRARVGGAKRSNDETDEHDQLDEQSEHGAGATSIALTLKDRLAGLLDRQKDETSDERAEIADNGKRALIEARGAEPERDLLGLCEHHLLQRLPIERTEQRCVHAPERSGLTRDTERREIVPPDSEEHTGKQDRRVGQLTDSKGQQMDTRRKTDEQGQDNRTAHTGANGVQFEALAEQQLTVQHSQTGLCSQL